MPAPATPAPAKSLKRGSAAAAGGPPEKKGKADKGDKGDKGDNVQTKARALKRAYAQALAQAITLTQALSSQAEWSWASSLRGPLDEALAAMTSSSSSSSFTSSLLNTEFTALKKSASSLSSFEAMLEEAVAGLQPLVERVARETKRLMAQQTARNAS